MNAEIITPENTLLDWNKGYAGIDTGAFVKIPESTVRQRQHDFFGKLSCLEFPSMKIYQQDNIELSKV